MNTFYPISLNLNEKTCIVIGGGKVAMRKIRRLLECGATVKVLSPRIEDALEHLLQEHLTLSWIKASYQGEKDLEGASLVFAATHIPSLNEKILCDANALGIFANIASHSELGDFIVPSSFNQGGLQVSISTSGKVPGLSKAIKETVEANLGPEYETVINILEEIRHLVLSDLDHKNENRYILSQITNNYQSILKDLSLGIDSSTIQNKLKNLLT